MATIEALEDQVAALEATLTGTATVVSAFEGELGRMRDTMLFTGREVNGLSTSIGSGLRRAFDGLAFDGLKLNDALKMVGRTIVDNIYNAAMKPVQNAFGGLIANGLNGLLGRVQPFAKGGIVSGPTNFPMQGGMGLMGEAGPEAIMPLARSADGRLGIQAAGGRQVTVVMNITTPDVQGFARSQTQIAEQAARALSRGQRNR
ncbi:MAG: phage tail tape measure protein [Rhodobacteraceae bacterium]|nr:phage tail tape measure protein [Paracoccaceae bacterium]